MTNPGQAAAGFNHRLHVLVAGADERTLHTIRRLVAEDCELQCCSIDAVVGALASRSFDGLIIDLDRARLSAGRLLGEARTRGLHLPARIFFLDGSKRSVAPPSMGEAVLLKKPLDVAALAALVRSQSDSRAPLGQLALAAGMP
ncbi:MAG: hypothetical protein GYA21_02675 [Myxococcales bacterium]|nr:hypothetical protein [Myxococcales bacterium]